MVYHPTPVQEFKTVSSIEAAGIRLLIKREDLNHPVVSGNKWWKLKYNLAEALEQNQTTLLTFGGAWSNHIYATAAAAAEMSLASIGIIRGEETRPLNPTLQFALQQGMQIQYISRAAYRHKTSAEFVQRLHDRFGPFYLIPEGGTNRLAIKGCAEFAEEELSGISFDHVFLPIGTGGTMAGLICGLMDTKNVVGVSVLKGGGFLTQEVENMTAEYAGKKFNRWSILTHYHHGGYAKVTAELLSFMEEMKNLHGVPLDPVYTGKLFWAVIKEIESGSFKRGDTILVLHTGGLQANAQTPMYAGLRRAGQNRN